MDKEQDHRAENKSALSQQTQPFPLKKANRHQMETLVLRAGLKPMACRVIFFCVEWLMDGRAQYPECESLYLECMRAFILIEQPVNFPIIPS